MSSSQGEFVTERLGYDGGREVTVYVPPAPVGAVVFAGDGGWHTVRLAGALERAGLASTMIVGVHGLADDATRLREYSLGFDEERFAAHETFFVEDVRRWTRSRFGVDPAADRTAIWGASLGGELALAMGLRHPEIYGVVFSLSPGAGYRPPAEMPPRLPRVYLAAGTQEPFFLQNAERWALALAGAGADVTLAERPGSHGDPFWVEEFPLMAAWAFGR